MDDEQTDTLTLTDHMLHNAGVVLPQTPGEAWVVLSAYLPTIRTPWNLLRGLVASILLAVPIMVFLGALMYLTLVAYVYLGGVAALALGGVGLVYGWDVASDIIDKLWRIDDETIRGVQQTYDS